jgi:hypothetical protein
MKARRYSRRGGFGHGLAVLVLCALHAWPRNAAATPGATLAAVTPPPLPQGGVYEPLGADVRVQGQAVAAWVFDAPATVPDLVAWFSARQPALRDMWVMPGSAVLGGVEGALHWAVRLYDAGQGRTRGTFSALSLADAGRAASMNDPGAVGWRPKGADLQFELRLREDGHAVIHQVWTHALAPARVWRNTQDALAAAGWHAAAQTMPVEAGCGMWSRSSTTLSVIVTAVGAGSGITTVLRIKE